MRRRSVAERVADGPCRDDRRVLAVGLGDAERGGHLLEEDDHRDADGEALDHRPRDVREVAAEPQRTPRRNDQHAGDQADDEHGVGAVAGDDRHEHDGHRPGRPRHLHVRAAEDRGDEAGDDRRDQPGLGAEARS